jgi:putative FmdB family regulatory protein
MPTYEYECPVHGVFEEMHSITIKLEHCAQCKEDGNEQEIKRLISLNGRGIVELVGQDLVDKVKSDTNKLKKDMYKSEKVYANLLGEDRYESMQKKIDKNKKR